MAAGRTKTSKFSKHTEGDTALSQPNKENEKPKDLEGTTFLGRVVIFLIFPTLVGFAGLYAGYLAKRDDPDKKLSFDDDFAYPFVLALTLCIVVGFRTGGFKSTKAQPLVAWPKIKKRRKIIHKHVVAGQNPDSVNVEPTKGEDAKKQD